MAWCRTELQRIGCDWERESVIRNYAARRDGVRSSTALSSMGINAIPSKGFAAQTMGGIADDEDPGII